MKINVKVNEKSWKFYLSKPDEIIKKKVKLLNKNIKFFSKKKFIATLVLSNTKEIKTLNCKFRGKNKSTDILSFPFNEKPSKKIFKRNKKVYLGDIIINLKKIKKKILLIILISFGYMVFYIFWVTHTKKIKNTKKC